ncbi:MAG: hypothetical protein A4E58_02773 [Syntrophorhabdus sp. PtaB.Bin006]|nr:MAG: hypothetical protein A4E58_02773 [Syntrophorhabdus sp. PtaB.Bin006]
MRQAELFLVFVFVLFFLAGVAYAGGGGGYEGHHGSTEYGKQPAGTSRPSDHHEGQEGKSHPEPGSSRPSGKSGGYIQKGQPEQKAVSPIGDREGYDLVIPSEVCRRFFDETTELRKVFDEKRAAHFKSRDNPATSPEEIAGNQAEIRELWRSIEERNSENCRWVH